jgi:hypothetical protein
VNTRLKLELLIEMRPSDEKAQPCKLLEGCCAPFNEHFALRDSNSKR